MPEPGVFTSELGEINHWIQTSLNDESRMENICETSKF
jgi:hypothetical protein